MYSPYGAGSPPSDADRQRVADQLQAALNSGRLGFPEFDSRLQRATNATSHAELRELSADLGGPSPASPTVPVAPVSPTPPVVAVPGYPQPPMPYMHPAYPVDPYGRQYSPKSKVAAGLLQLFLGEFGIGRFYTGHVGIGIAQLLTCGGCGIWAFIDGIVLLAGNPNDSEGRPMK